MAQFAFKFISGKYQGGEFPIPDEGELIIGRSNELDLVLVEDMVSRKHAKLVANGETITITDLGSTNGTFVNGEKVRRTDLALADRILIGTSILKVIGGTEMSLTGNEDASEIREMMEELGNRDPGTSTMSGELDEVPLPDLLQLFATNKKSGVLTITGAHRGKLYIRAGQLEYALVGNEPSMKPMKALGRMIGWTSGSFNVEPYEDEESPFEETFQESTESILMEVLRQHDELKNLMTELPDPTAALELCVPMTPRLADLDESELDTLQMALNFDTLQTVIDRATSTDYKTVTNLHKLLKEGYLEVEV